MGSNHVSRRLRQKLRATLQHPASAGPVRAAVFPVGEAQQESGADEDAFGQMQVFIERHREASGETTERRREDGGPHKTGAKNHLDGTLSEGYPDRSPGNVPTTAQEPDEAERPTHVTLMDEIKSGGSMSDLSGYKDLSKPPMVSDDEDEDNEAVETHYHRPEPSRREDSPMNKAPVLSAEFGSEAPASDIDTEFSNNVRTLIRLVNDLPEGVTKQTGAQIIRLTMEAMGISMEDVLSEAQSAQSEMLDAVRANIKKIEEYKTVIRKLETDIKYYQGKANELSEIIDLFILSNASPQIPNVDELTEEQRENR